ncbi:MAG: 3'-5' exoribonuclease [Bacteroidetes bacterium]|nr:3'-5' exoribonuclease [Bacteroidota bacterium]
MNFTAIDFETANEKRWSICQVGIVRVEQGRVIKQYEQLIKPPENFYASINTQIHGISSEDTINAPNFAEIWDDIKPFIENNLVIAHNSSFDVDCLNKTLDFYKIPIPHFKIECTYKKTGYRLDDLCEAYSIEFQNHHNALADAIACAKIYLNILYQIEPDYSLVTKKEPKNYFIFKGHERIKGDLLKPDLEHADKSNPFYGKKVVFTGALSNIKRNLAAQILKDKGADIDTSVTKRTNIVVLGKDPGPSKVKKIENFNKAGYQIRVLKESEFLSMIK